MTVNSAFDYHFFTVYGFDKVNPEDSHFSRVGSSQFFAPVSGDVFNLYLSKAQNNRIYVSESYEGFVTGKLYLNYKNIQG